MRTFTWHRSSPSRLSPAVFLALLLPFMLDLPFQAAQILDADVTRQTRSSSVDLKDFIWLFSKQTNMDPTSVKIGVIVGRAGRVDLDYPDIFRSAGAGVVQEIGGVGRAGDIGIAL